MKRNQQKLYNAKTSNLDGKKKTKNCAPNSWRYRHTHKYSFFFLRLLRVVFSFILFAFCKRFELLTSSLTACELFGIPTPWLWQIVWHNFLHFAVWILHKLCNLQIADTRENDKTRGVEAKSEWNSFVV